MQNILFITYVKVSHIFMYVLMKWYTHSILKFLFKEKQDILM